MKSIKLFGIAVVAAAALTVLLGAASASATVLCKENVSTCSAGSVYASGTAIEASLKSGTNLTLKSGEVLPAVTCSESTLSGKTTAEHGSPLPAEVSSLTLSCQKNVSGTEVLNLPYAAGVEKTSTGNGTIALSSGGKGTPSIKFTKPFGLNATCIYGASPLSLTLEGGNPGTLTASATLTKQEGSGAICPASATLAASYEVTSPKPAFATAGPLSGYSVLCKEQSTICPASATYANGTLVEAAGENMEVFGGYFGGHWFSCSGTMSLESTATAGKPLPVKGSMVFSAACIKSSECENMVVTVVESSVGATSGGNGNLKTAFSVDMTGCAGGTAQCHYATELSESEVVGSNLTPSLKLNATLTKQTGSGALCSTYFKINGKYNVSSPTPLWVEKAEA